MSQGINKALLGVVGASLMATTPVIAQDTEMSPSTVKVGIIDVKANSLTFGDKNTKIEYQPYTQKGKLTAEWITESDFDHGQMMASAFVRQLRQVDQNAPIRIYAANVFQENSGTGGAKYSHSAGTASKRTLSVNWEGATQALDWFKQNGVTVVLTAFNTTDTPALRSFMKRAGVLGMTVFASAGNKVGGATFPAAYPEAISVAGDNKDLAFRQDANLSRWVNFTMDGGVPKAKAGKRIDVGSSFATAKAAAFGAYYVSHNPDAGRDAIASAIKEATTPQNYTVQGISVVMPRFDEETSSLAMSKIVRKEVGTGQVSIPKETASVSQPTLAQKAAMSAMRGMAY